MKICILIPIYNESKNIGSIVQAIVKKEIDVIVIDDGSTDGSGDIAKQYGAVVITHDQKHGKGWALQSGFDRVMEEDYLGIITMDGDGQHAVEDLDQFLAGIRENPRGVVAGSRMEDIKNMPRVRYYTNRFMSMLISAICRQNVPDTQCGYRYISCDILRSIHISSAQYEIETEVLIKAAKKGYSITSVPVQTIYRDETSHIHPIKDTFRFFAYLIKEMFSR